MIIPLTCCLVALGEPSTSAEIETVDDASVKLSATIDGGTPVPELHLI
jgi:hypothetical protein